MSAAFKEEDDIMTDTTIHATVSTYICVSNAVAAIDFYTRAFDAIERYRIDGDGKIGHAELAIGNTVIMLSDEYPEIGVVSPGTLKGASTSFVLDIPDLDAAWKRALDAGATIQRPIEDNPYGRGGWVTDPFGYRWSIMTSNPDFNPEDMK